LASLSEELKRDAIRERSLQEQIGHQEQYIKNGEIILYNQDLPINRPEKFKYNTKSDTVQLFFSPLDRYVKPKGDEFNPEHYVFDPALCL
jgi:hypothetical protein